jgi:hypothetical protein
MMVEVIMTTGGMATTQPTAIPTAAILTMETVTGRTQITEELVSSGKP